MGSKHTDLLLKMVVLVVAFDSGNCNTQHLEKIKSIQSNAVNFVENYQSVVDRDSRSVHRFRRDLTPTEMQEVVDTHNRVRRLEGASNMEIMIWSDELARKADAWATRCVFAHSNYPNLGENLYAISNSFTINLTVAIMAWYNEKKDYNYDTLGCSAEMCGHYTQVVWANSRELGCAYARCPTLRPNMTNATYLSCNYRPAGNVVGSKPFLKGNPCSKCTTRSWWCNEGLCDRSCTTAGPTCGCAPVCLNFGSVKNTTCSCICPPGWYGSDCSVVCKDNDQRCNNQQPNQETFPPSWCNDGEHDAIARESCPAMCNQCTVLNNNNNNYSTSTKPSLLSILAVWLSWLLLYSFYSI